MPCRSRPLEPVLAHLNTHAPIAGCSVTSDRREGRKMHLQCGSPRDAGGVPPGLVSEGCPLSSDFGGGVPSERIRECISAITFRSIRTLSGSIRKTHTGGCPLRAHLRGVSPQGGFWSRGCTLRADCDQGDVPSVPILAEGVHPQCRFSSRVSPQYRSCPSAGVTPQG